MITAIRILRTTLRATWLLVTVGLLVLVALPHLVGYLGAQLFIVRGASMEPSIPFGSAVIVRSIAPADLRSGDVVSFQLDNGTVVTHRIIGVNADPSGYSFETKGDASASADAVPIPAQALRGKVEYLVPGLGMVLYALSTTFGAVAMIGLLVGLLLAVWFADDLLVAARNRESIESKRVVAEPAR